MSNNPQQPTIEDLFGEEDDDDELLEPPLKRQALSPGAEEGAEEAEDEGHEATADAPTGDGEEEAAVETADDRAFIDDAEVDPEERYIEDEAGQQQYQLEEAEEVVEDELDAIFTKGKRKKAARSQEDVNRAVDTLVAKLESAAEFDIELHNDFKPAIHKLKMLPELEQMVGNKLMHRAFLDAGGLGALRAWLEPFQRDHSLPNAKIRSVVLRLLRQLNIDMSDPGSRSMVKESGIGKNVMFLFKLPEETAPNRKLAKSLVEAWARPIFFDPDRDTSRETRARQVQVEEARRAGKAAERARAGNASQDGEEEEEGAPSQQGGLRPGDPGFRWRASVPQAARMDYTKRPESLVVMDGGTGRKARNDKMGKHLEKLSRKGRTGVVRKTQVSIQGRGLAM
ncbi:hypothetical protein WJX73_001426 [Symbiochloris irregularis]|uniref:TFIIS N-terminal domain-containing protein n=1 Tax=Symbiochloris irregularis TaxID=706552 RepID=A0AAW1PSH9_9CHLO